ncbi:sensor histidine kinase [Streptosporangium sp. KLBMP 9127]|nr:sensor histidine kinase [Streptosporangium sp. KLBMP 9127]
MRPFPIPPNHLLTGLTIVGVLGGTVATWHANPDVSLNAWDVAIPLVIATALLFRRRRPLAVLGVIVISCATYYPLAALDGPVMVAALVALFSAADLGHVLAALIIATLLVLGIALGEVRTSVRHVDDSQFLLITGWMIAVVAFGGVTHNRRAYLQEAEQRVREAERTKEEEAMRRTVEERLRIARELHDVLGHNISLINVQAGAALHRLRERPEQAEIALTAIKATSKETLRELRATLGVLRQVDEATPVAPAPSLTRVQELIDRTELDVATEVAGQARELPAEIDLAAVRIVQESLTNVSRHSGANAASVHIGYGTDTLSLRIDDQGPGVSPGVPGYGIKGMRERAQALGGTLDAGPRPDGGFRVTATFPLTT